MITSVQWNTRYATTWEKHLKNKSYIIVTHRENLKKLCDRHFIFENHEMKEVE